MNAASYRPEGSVPPFVIRTPDQRVRVFVSSTLEELAPERTAAKEAITQLRLTPVLFESGARPYPPRELYRAYLAQSDVFLGLYWQRYGWVAPEMTISGLEDEYRLSSDKPRLIYLKTPAPAREPALQALLDRIRSEEVSSYQRFATPEELRDRIANDLAQLLTERFTSPTDISVAARLAPLPVPRTRLIDRDQERTQAKALLQQEDVGVLTLTGPGGVGKTRLAVQVAVDLAPQFADGAAFVSLESLTDPQLLAPTIARALGLPDTRQAAANEALMEYLEPRYILLVLDNVEQLVATAAPLAAQALELAPRLKLLVTSRELLRVHGERSVSVAPLELPDPEHLSDPERLAQVPAVALFVERAHEAQPDFALTTENAAAIVEICRRLDGLPLALELAAARLSLLTPSALLQRLGHRLPVLTRGARDLPQRQQTLRNTIAWSYDLLDEGEQQLFRRLSVFVGGFVLEAAQAISLPDTRGPSSSDQVHDGVVLDQLAQLLDKSLVRTQQSQGGEPRFGMLDTIREYAQEQMEASGEKATIQQRHAQYFLLVAEEAEPHLYVPTERESWLERWDREQANLRAALTWCKATEGEVESGLRLAGALSMYWYLRGAVHEGREWLEEMLARTGNADRSKARGRVLGGVGMLAWVEGDSVAAPRLEEALSIARELEDKFWIANTALNLGLTRLGLRDIASARSLCEESHRLSHELGYVWVEARALFGLGAIDYVSRDLVNARRLYEESLRLFLQQGDTLYASVVSIALEVVASAQGDEEMVRSLRQQRGLLMQQATHRGAYGLFLIFMGDIAGHLVKDELQAELMYKEGLRLWHDLHQVGQGIGIVRGLTGLAEIATAQGRAERAGRLFGAAARLLPVTSFYRDDLNARVTAARARLDAATFEAAWSEGEAMTEQQAITCALQDA